MTKADEVADRPLHLGKVEQARSAARIGTRRYDVIREAFADGLLVRVTGDTIALAPLLIISEAQIDELVENLARAIGHSGETV
jgi:beta-alanine--pyruvate transaminase